MRMIISEMRGVDVIYFWKIIGPFFQWICWHLSKFFKSKYFLQKLNQKILWFTSIGSKDLG